MIRNARAILALLTALNLLNYLDRFVLSAVLPKVQDDLHLSNFVGGSLATVFLIGYFATSPIFGTLADRAPRGGRRTLVALGIAVWSAATVASGLAGGGASLVAARAVVGVGEASYATIAPTIIDDIAPASQKGRWLAIFYAAMPIGSALGYLVGGAVEHTRGWRAAFFVAGGPGLLLAILCLLIAEPARSASATRPDVLGSAATLLRIPFYRRALAGYCAYTFALGGFAYWAPKYIHARYDLDLLRANFVFGIVTVVGGAIGTLAGGWLGDRAARSRATDDGSVARGNLSVCTMACAIGAPLAAGAVIAGSARGFFTIVFPCEIALFLLNGPINVVVLRSVPSELRASAMALSIFAIHLLGDLWSPPLIGLVADHAPIAYAMLACPAAFGLAAVVWWRTGLARLT